MNDLDIEIKKLNSYLSDANNYLTLAKDVASQVRRRLVEPSLGIDKAPGDIHSAQGIIENLLYLLKREI